MFAAIFWTWNCVSVGKTTIIMGTLQKSSGGTEEFTKMWRRKKRFRREDYSFFQSFDFSNVYSFLSFSSSSPFPPPPPLFRFRICNVSFVCKNSFPPLSLPSLSLSLFRNDITCRRWTSASDLHRDPVRNSGFRIVSILPLPRGLNRVGKTPMNCCHPMSIWTSSGSLGTKWIRRTICNGAWFACSF